MTTDDAGLLDEIQEASDVDTLTVAEEAIVAHPPAEPCKKNLRESSALDIAERCSERFGLTQAVCESAKFLREVDKKSRRLLYLDQLSQFVAGSQAIPVAVGLVFGQALSKNVDSFVSAFVSPVLAVLGGKTHLASMHFTINEAVFAYGDFMQSVIQTAFTVVALFYLVVIPMSTFTPLKYVHHVPCSECQTWIKETAKRCPMCGQPTDFLVEDGDDAARAQCTKEDDTNNATAGKRGGRSKFKDFMKMWTL